MGWRLYFYRRVGEPALTLDAVDEYFSARPGYTREPELAAEPDADGITSFRLSEAEAPLTLTFTFESWPPEEEPQGRADFPYEETPLSLDMDYCQPDTARQRAVREAVEVCETLGLLIQDPQLGPEEPLRPDPQSLERSYTQFSDEVAQTIAYLRSRRRMLVLTGAGLLLAGLLLLLFSTLGGGR